MKKYWKKYVSGTSVLLLAILTLSNAFLIKQQKTSYTDSKAALNSTYDIVVAGAGLGGSAAALQAARMGSRVLLLEETNMIGGQASAGGVNCIDTGLATYNTGIYREYEDRAAKYYSDQGLAIDKCWSGVSFEPHITNQVLTSMFTEQPNITLLKNTLIKSVQKSGSQIISVTLSSGQIINTKIVIDATEYGDVIPLAKANYRVGNGSVVNGNIQIPSDACIQDITYTAAIKKYPNGVPTSLRISTPPPGYTTTIENNFKTIVTKNGSSGWQYTYPVNFAWHNTYRGMPNSTEKSADITKTSINWANDYPAVLPYVGDYTTAVKLNAKYLTDKNYRNQANCEAKLKTYQFMYYMQSPTGLSEPNWSVANDETYDLNFVPNSPSDCPLIPNDVEKYMPPLPYIRESIRIIGKKTLTAKDIKRTENRPWQATSYQSSIALGSYSNDLHNCATDDVLESSLNETRNDISYAAGPYEIPLEALISDNVDGLLAAEKNISASRLASAAVRVHPSAMLNGQAAGALAVISVKNNIKPSQVKAFDVQKALVQQKSMVLPYTDYDQNNTYFADMQLMALRNIMVGYGNLKFGPNDPLTRGQMAVVISKSFDIPPVTPKGIFSDVPVTDQFVSFIEAIYPSITLGCGLNPLIYCPTKNISNGEFAVFALRGWQRINPSISTSTSTTSYSDVSSTEPFKPYIEGLAVKGIKWYCDKSANKFCSASALNRATASYVLNQILLKENK
jgi:hypothetical protein